LEARTISWIRSAVNTVETDCQIVQIVQIVQKVQIVRVRILNGASSAPKIYK
jgi:hypothetical protein